jgi:glycosyltransferase involved in cell wall biosynthesis
MPRVVLVQPDPGGAISGGYLYNSQMAAHGAWTLCQANAEQLGAVLAAIEGDLVLADSLWLAESTFEPFLELARRLRVGVLMHSFPSMIAAAERRLPVAREPARFEIRALEQVGLVVVPGPHYAALLRNADVDVRIAEPGIADAWRTSPRRRGTRCSLVSVGAVTARKGFLDVLAALEGRSARGDWQWTAVGSLTADAAYAREVRERAAALEGVTLAGQLAPDLVRAVVRGADVLVMPSYDENQPLVLLEAMAASVPAVAYDAGAAARMVRHGVEGLLSPVGDRRRLAEHLARVIDDEAERYRMALACWERQKELPSWEIAAARARAALADGLARAWGRN